MNNRFIPRVLCVAAGLVLLTSSAQAGSATYDFSTDPTTDPNIQFYSDIPDETGYPNWLSTGGNPGGFLILTYAATAGYENTHIIFPDLDPGKIVTAFTFECDLRVGNGTARPADGFSINFARANDPVISQWEAGSPGRGYAGDSRSGFSGGEDASLPETGTITGIAICFDTWSGNAMPDGTDLEGIMVRLDNKTLPGPTSSRGFPMPTRNGACDNATSMQTGARDDVFWNEGGDPFTPDGWDTLCWAHLKVVMDETAKLTVTWKGKILLDAYQTAYFPSPGRLIFGARTGGSYEQTHVDNIKLETVAQVLDNEKPTVPANLRAEVTGAYRVLLAWDASTDNSGRVAYEIEQDGTALTGVYTAPSLDARGLKPNTTYTFRVRATDVSGNKTDWVSLSATTVGDIDDPNYAAMKIYGTTAAPISGTTVDLLLADARYPNSPDQTVRLNSMFMSFGEPLFGDTYGENRGFRIAGTITPTESGQYDFFVRSDDASQLYLNKTGAAIPVADGLSQVCEETDCCEAFVDPGTLNDDGLTSATTTEPITLQAGQTYGILFIVQEGGGGDYGQVAWRKVGDTTAPASLTPIGMPFFKSEAVPKADPVGAVATLDEPPQNLTVFANDPVTFTVKVTASSPYTESPIYQWYRDGKGIAGATGFSYSIPVVSPADNGAKFSFLAAVPGKSATSSEATLTVLADTKSPTMMNVEGSDAMNTVLVRFSEPVSAASATAMANYQLDNGLTVSTAKMLDQHRVLLTTSTQSPDTIYTLTVNNVADTAGNKIAANSTFKFHSYVLKSGQVRALFYNNISGSVLTDLTGNAKFPNLPDEILYLTSLASPDGKAENYGAMVRGFIAPTESASYDFFLYSDDASAIYLNTTGEVPPDPLTATPIAQETDCCDVFSDPGTLNDDGTTSATTTSPIALQAGQRYGLTVLLKEGTSGDFVQVAWRKSTDTTAPASLTPIAAAVLGCFAPAPATNVLSPTDTIVSTHDASRSPAAEQVANVIDGNTQTKYLNFGDGTDTSAPLTGITGFTVTPKAGATIITGITLTSANDAPERDPASYLIEGLLEGKTFTAVAEGAVPKFSDRFTAQTLTFANSTPYLIYKVTFPTVYNQASANSMQIAEVALLGNVYGGTITQPSGEKPEITGWVKNTDGSYTLTWTGGGVLEAATAITGPWQDVIGATSPYTFTPQGTAMFGRIKK